MNSRLAILFFSVVVLLFFTVSSSSSIDDVIQLDIINQYHALGIRQIAPFVTEKCSWVPMNQYPYCDASLTNPLCLCFLRELANVSVNTTEIRQQLVDLIHLPFTIDYVISRTPEYNCTLVKPTVAQFLQQHGSRCKSLELWWYYKHILISIAAFVVGRLIAELLDFFKIGFFMGCLFLSTLLNSVYSIIYLHETFIGLLGITLTFYLMINIQSRGILVKLLMMSLCFFSITHVLLRQWSTIESTFYPF